MVPTSREGYKYLEVFRPVLNRPEKMLGIIATIGARLFGEKTIASFSETQLQTEDAQGNTTPLSLKTRPTPITQQRLEVYHATDLHLLLARKATPVSRTRYNFNSQANIFTLRSKHMTTKGQRSEATLASKVDAIMPAHGLPTYPTEIEFEPKLYETSDPVYGPEFALVLKAGKWANRAIADQVAMVHQALPQNTQQPASPFIPLVPVAHVPEEIGKYQYEEFLDTVSQAFVTEFGSSIILTLGKVDAAAGTKTGQGY